MADRVPPPPKEIHIPYCTVNGSWFGDISEYYKSTLTGRAARYVLVEEYVGEEIPRVVNKTPVRR